MSKIEVENRIDIFAELMKAAPIQYSAMRVYDEQTGESRHFGFSTDRNGNIIDSDTMCLHSIDKDGSSFVCRLPNKHSGPHEP